MITRKEAEAIIIIVNDLMDMIEETRPDLYYSSDEIARADDLIKELEIIK